LCHFSGFFASKSSLKSIFIPYFDREGDLARRCAPIAVSLATVPKQALNKNERWQIETRGFERLAPFSYA